MENTSGTSKYTVSAEIIVLDEYYEAIYIPLI